MNSTFTTQIGFNSRDLPNGGQLTHTLQPNITLQDNNLLVDLSKDPKNLSKIKNQRDLFSELVHRFENGPQWFQNFRSSFSLGITSLGAIFNGLAAIANSTNLFSKNFSKLMDKQGELFAKYIKS